MHELYIAECILQSARRALPKGISSDMVERIHVRVGRLDAVVPETLQFTFDAIKASHHMPRAALVILEQNVRCRCQGCAHEFALTEPVFICPECGNAGIKVLTGRGITLESMDINDEACDADPCGNGCT